MMHSPPNNLLRYGSSDDLPTTRLLRAGPLSLVYEAGDLRYIRWGRHEILRRMYVAVRDHNWDTLPPRLSNVQITTTDTAFSIAYDAEHQHGSVDFLWKATIRGEESGAITFSMDGIARSTFLRNRIGFCVLHPMDAARAFCRVEHVDGTITEGAFPTTISPHQPFLDMRTITHLVTPGLMAEVRLEGDTFEMEDQRNWTDASFKTYCTPLALPFPVKIETGTRVSQSVRLVVSGQPEETGDVSPEIYVQVRDRSSIPLPRLGLGLASHGADLDATSVARLRALQLSHLRADLHLDSPAYAAVLRRAISEARALHVGLELAVFLGADPEHKLLGLAGLVKELAPPVDSWLIFHADEKSTRGRWVDLARKHLGSGSSAKIGSGTNAYFTELNRERPPVDLLDVVAYSINPQVHAFDNASLAETLAAQAVTVDSARHFCGNVPVAVSPVTLRPRFNPNATGAAPEHATGTLPPEVDPRQTSLFGAGWTLGSIKYLFETSVQSATYYETTGWRGVMETAEGSPWPVPVAADGGMVFPLYHVLAYVGDFRSGVIVPTTSSAPLVVEALALGRGDNVRVLMANLGQQSQQVDVGPLPTKVRIKMLDESNALEAMVAPEAFRAGDGELRMTTDGHVRVDLPPFAVVCIDGQHDRGST